MAPQNADPEKVIGLRDVYDICMETMKKLDGHILIQGLEVVQLKLRVAELEKDKDLSGQRRWLLYTALVGTATSLAVALLSLVTK